MNPILLLILSLSQCVYYVNMSINRNGDGSDADNDVFESLQFVYIRKKKEMIVSIYITFALRQTMNFRFDRNNKQIYIP
jgi:hypothetical protein